MEATDSMTQRQVEDLEAKIKRILEQSVKETVHGLQGLLHDGSEVLLRETLVRMEEKGTIKITKNNVVLEIELNK